MSFMLPAYASYNGVTIVIVLLIALQANLVKRCRAVQIQAEA